MEKIVIYLIIAVTFIAFLRRLWVLFSKDEPTDCSCGSKCNCSEGCECNQNQNKIFSECKNDSGSIDRYDN